MSEDNQKDNAAHEANESQAEKDKELVELAHKRFEHSVEIWRDNRKAFADDLDFIYGNQWPADIERDRDIQGRPCITVNRMPQFVRQVTNDQRQNRPSIKVRAVDDFADVETAEIMQGLIRHIEANSNADLAYDNGTYYSVGGGFGFWRIVTDYAPNSFDQEIYIRPIENTLSVYPDADSKSLDGSDWQYCFIVEEMPRKEFEKEYGDQLPENWDSGDNLQSGGWLTQDTVRLAEYFVVEQEKDTLLKLEDGRILYKSDYAAEGNKVKIADQRPVMRPSVKWYKLAAKEIIDRKDWAGKYIPVVPVFGEQMLVDGKRKLISLIRHGKDSQRMINYYRSTEAEIYALQPKAPFIAAEGQIEGYEDDWADANNVNLSVLIYKPTPIAGQPVPPPQRSIPMGLPQGALAMAEIAANDLMDTIGIHQAGLGMKSNESSGRAIMARQREGDTGTFHFIDNCVRAIRFTGMILVDLIPKIYDTPRCVRILGEDGSEKSVMVNSPIVSDQAKEIERIYDLSLGQYDVVCAAGASYTTRRQEAADAMTQMLQGNPQLMQIAGDLFVKAMDWPGAEEIAERIAKTLPPNLRPKEEEGEDAAPHELPPDVQQKLQAADQMQQQMQQMDQVIQKMQAELDSKQAQAQNDQQKIAIQAQQVQVDQYKAETDRLRAQADAASKANADLKDSEKVQFQADFEKLKLDMQQDFLIELEWLKSRLASGQGILPVEAQAALESVTDGDDVGMGDAC